MDGIAAFVEIAVFAALVATPAIAMVRFLDGNEAIGAALVRPPDVDWPRGIQEEEPRPWSSASIAGNAAAAT